MYQYLDAVDALVGEHAGMVHSGLAKLFNYSSQGGIRNGAHIHRLSRQSDLINTDHDCTARSKKWTAVSAIVANGP
jgi:hypothetical protein